MSANDTIDFWFTVGSTYTYLTHIKKSVVIKRSIMINGHKTSVSLENEFWDGLHEVARDEHTTAPTLVEQVARSSDNCNLSSAIRLFVFNRLRRGNGNEVVS
jgi:predicted DNA-binding ribbon-helix-helix protein